MLRNRSVNDSRSIDRTITYMFVSLCGITIVAHISSGCRETNTRSAISFTSCTIKFHIFSVSQWTKSKCISRSHRIFPSSQCSPKFKALKMMSHWISHLLVREKTELKLVLLSNNIYLNKWLTSPLQKQ